MKNIFIILITFIFFYHKRENFQYECWIYGDDYNACYSNSNSIIGFLQDGSTTSASHSRNYLII